MSDPKLGFSLTARDLTKNAFRDFNQNVRSATKSIQAIGVAGESFSVLEKKIKRLDKTSTSLKGHFKALAKSAMSLKGGILAITAGYGLQQTASAIISVSSGFEQMEKKLDILTRGKGKETLERLNKWALDMPVSTMGAVDAFTMMRAMGLNPTIEKMQTLVDVSSIFGGDSMHRIARALGQIRSLGKISAEELNQLSEVGVNAREILLETFGMSIEGLQKSGKDIKEIINAIWQGLDARYSGAAKASMDSWAGLVATFKSYMTELTRKFMNAGIFDALKDGMKDINGYLKNWLDSNQKFMAQELPGYLKHIAESIRDLAGFAITLTNGVLNLLRAAKAVDNFLHKGPIHHKTNPYAKDYTPPVSKLEYGPEPGEVIIEQLRVPAIQAAKPIAKIKTDLKAIVEADKILQAQSENSFNLKYERFLDELNQIGETKNPFENLESSIKSLEEKEIAPVLRIQEQINQARQDAAKLLQYGEADLYQSSVVHLQELENRLQGSNPWKKMLNEQNKASEDMKSLAKSTASIMQNTFSSVLIDGMKGQFKSLGDYIKNLLNSIAQMMANFYAQKAMQGIFGNLGGGAATASSTGTPSVAMASGGVITEHIVGYGVSGTRYEFGEGGRAEAIMPLSRMTRSGGYSRDDEKPQPVTPPAIKLIIHNNSSQPIEEKDFQFEITTTEIVAQAWIEAVEHNVCRIRNVLGRG